MYVLCIIVLKEGVYPLLVCVVCNVDSGRAAEEVPRKQLRIGIWWQSFVEAPERRPVRGQGLAEHSTLTAPQSSHVLFLVHDYHAKHGDSHFHCCEGAAVGVNTVNEGCGVLSGMYHKNNQSGCLPWSFKSQIHCHPFVALLLEPALISEPWV